jgi:hypothetical protein
MIISLIGCRVVVTWWEISNILQMESVLTSFKRESIRRSAIEEVKFLESMGSA